MARPSVPHCKDCKYLGDYRSPGSLYGFWFCRSPNLQSSKNISSQEVRTCPLWCPLRLRGHRKAY